MVLALVILLPRHHNASSFAVEAKAVQDALKLSIQDAADRQLDAAMGATVVHDVGAAVPVTPSNQGFAKHGEAHRLVGCDVFRLQDRIPVVPQSLGQTGRQIGRNILDAGQSLRAMHLVRGCCGDACWL